MKKIFKIILGVIVILILSLLIDLVCIFTINKPLFAVTIDDGYSTIYKGLFFDTYNCKEYSMLQIKGKRAKFTCSKVKLQDYKIIDMTKDIKDFSCDTALESFYEDEDYIYYWNCIKNKYMGVVYKDGYLELVSDALKNNKINITDLDRFNISYIKKEK